MKIRYLDCDLQPRFKNGLETAAVIGIAAGVAALGSGIASSVAQNKATNAQKDIMREQMAYQTSEREAVQEYNTPENQRARFEQAGLNPYLMMGSGNAGNSEMQSGVGMPDIKANTGIADMLANLTNTGLSSAMQYEQLQAQNEALEQARIETLFKEREKLAQLGKTHAETAKLLSDTSKNHAEYDVLQKQYQREERELKRMDLELKYHEDWLSSRNKKQRNEADLIYEQKLGQHLTNEYQRSYNAAFPKLNQAQLRLLAGQTYQAVKAGDLSKSMSEHEAVKKIGTILQNGISANQFTLQEVDLTEAEIKLMRLGKIKELQENSNTWLKVRTILDDFKETFPSIIRLGR